MKKLNNTFAAVAVALGISLAPHANAAVTFKPNGVGDALLFPVFNGYVENYFTISNHDDLWVQGHIRFRGAAWSAELRDFDVILSPGDVLVFRVADIDGDGQWEIDQSLDVKNFQYTGMVHSCTGTSGNTIENCLDPSNLLEPRVNEQNTKVGITPALIEHQRHVGYVEFIGEAVLNHMSHPIMNTLTSGNPGNWASYVTKNGNGRGTSAWKWSAAELGFPPAGTNPILPLPYNRKTELAVSAISSGSTHVNLGLSDVGNVLSGTAFITLPGQSHGLAYNADALVNFRTNSIGNHRIENYGLASDQVGSDPGAAGAVIVHHENASSNPIAASPAGDYVYGCPGLTEPENSPNSQLELGDELVISFNNTWGPTLADGDDFDGLGITTGGSIADVGLLPDTWDFRRSALFRQDEAGAIVLWLYGDPRVGKPGFVANRYQPYLNSVSEVESAIAAAGQNFYSYYFDSGELRNGAGLLKSYFFGFFPSKYFYGENIVVARTADTCQNFIDYTVGQLVNLAKEMQVIVMDTQEEPCVAIQGQAVSPARPKPDSKTLGQELSFFDINWLKSGNNTGSCSSFKSGRAQISLDNANLSQFPDGFPGLLYTFEAGNDGWLSQWRAMQR
jgi:hypothetical protein